MSETPPNSTSPTLLQKVLEQDPAAQGRFIDWIGPLIDYWCRALSVQDREDTLHDVLLVILEQLKDFRGGPGSSFRGWVRVIVTHKISDLCSRNKRQPQAMGGDAYQHLLEQTVQGLSHDDGNEASILLWRALEQIRDDFQPHVFQAFWLSDVDGLSSAEIQAKLGMAANAIRQARSRVRRRLREVYGDLER